jgi:DNA repair protein RAD51
LTGRDIKLFVDAGYHTVEAVAYTYVYYVRRVHRVLETLAIALLLPHLLTCAGTIRPKRLLEQIKGISEQKATKILVEGKPTSSPAKTVA